MTVKTCLAHASPEIASISWLIINALCLVCSLNLALCNLWINHQQKSSWRQQQQQQQVTNNDNSELFESEAVQATVEYLVWSLVTTIVWIVEVALRTAFPSVSEHDFDSNHQPEKAADTAYRIQRAAAADDDDDSSEQTKKTIMHQQKVQTRVLVVELILALFFLVESILDCLHWRARVKEDDFVQQELDIWINIFAYIYMTYETFKTARAKKERQGFCFCWPTRRTAASTLNHDLIQDVEKNSQNSSHSYAANIPKVV